jgi:hypothetical protein
MTNVLLLVMQVLVPSMIGGAHMTCMLLIAAAQHLVG